MGLRLFKITSLLFACILLFISNSDAQETHDEKHIEVSLRMIGHKVLLNSDDSTSLVLPIQKENGQYRIQFESEFGFNPDELVNAVSEVVKDTKIAKGYMMEVEQCETGDVVYSYEIGDLENNDIIPCKGRDQPKACYSILLTLTGELNGPDRTSDRATGALGESHEMTYALIVLAAVLLIVLLIILWKRRAKSKVNPNLIQLGNFYFDKHNTELILKEQRIELTSKEADLLLVLYKDANETVERDVILNVVWGDEGDYVGRTLDVFVSKLRKKLEADSSVKIVNIRGVGYKLLVN